MCDATKRSIVQAQLQRGISQVPFQGGFKLAVIHSFLATMRAACGQQVAEAFPGRTRSGLLL